MNYKEIENEVRRRVVSAAKFDPVKDLKLEGYTFDNSGKSLWVEEFIIGGDNRQMTNARMSIAGYLIQYNFCTPCGSGMEKAKAMAETLETSFAGVIFDVNGTDCTCTSVSISKEEGKVANRVKVLLTFNINRPVG
jgi:hypothetical protein